MAQSRDQTSNKDSADQTSWELLDAHPGHAPNATIPGKDQTKHAIYACLLQSKLRTVDLVCCHADRVIALAANNEPNGRDAQQETLVTCSSNDGLPSPQALPQPPNVPISSVEDAAERQKIIDRQMENLQPPENSADALILFHASLSLFNETGLHASNAKRIQHFLVGDFVGKPSHTVVAASHELAHLSQKYGIADNVRKAASEFRGNVFGPKDVTDASHGRQSDADQESREATGRAHKKQQREKAATRGPSGKVGGPIWRFTVCLSLVLGLVIYLVHVAHEHETQRLHKDEMDKAFIELSACRSELEEANDLNYLFRAAIREQSESQKRSSFRLFG